MLPTGPGGAGGGQRRDDGRPRAGSSGPVRAALVSGMPALPVPRRVQPPGACGICDDRPPVKPRPCRHSTSRCFSGLPSVREFCFNCRRLERAAWCGMAHRRRRRREGHPRDARRLPRPRRPRGVVAADGAALEALLAAGRRPDLFVLDLGLPGPGRLRARADAARAPRPRHRHPDRRRRPGRPRGRPRDRRRRLCAQAGGAARARRAHRRGAAPPPPGRRAAPAGPSLRRPTASTCAPSACATPPGRPVDLSPMEVDLVAAFATNPGRVLTRDDLMRLAPPRDDDSNDRSIDHRVTRLRRKLESRPRAPAADQDRPRHRLRPHRGKGMTCCPLGVRSRSIRQRLAGIMHQRSVCRVDLRLG